MEYELITKKYNILGYISGIPGQKNQIKHFDLYYEYTTSTV